MAQEAAVTEPAKGEKPAALPEPKDKAGTPSPESGEPPKTFDADYVKTLRSEAAANRKRAQDAEAKIEELSDKDKSELQKLTGKLSKAEQKAQDAENRLARYEVAAEKKVPPEWVGRLKGTTREELEADAVQLLDQLKSQNETKETDFDGGAREPAPDSNPEAAHNDIVQQLIGSPTKL